MKNFFKILKGQIEASSAQITVEIDKLKEMQGIKKETLEKVAIDLKDDRLENLAGVKNGSEIQILEKELLDLESEISVLSDTIDDLLKAFMQAKQKESLAEIKVIDDKILAYKNEKIELQERFLKLAGEAAGIWHILGKGVAFSASKSQCPLPFGKSERRNFDEGFEKTNKGRGSITNSITKLRLKRETLVETLPIEMSKSFGLKNTAQA